MCKIGFNLALPTGEYNSNAPLEHPPKVPPYERSLVRYLRQANPILQTSAFYLYLCFPAAYEKLVVANAELQNALVDFEARGEELEVGRFFADHFDGKLLVVERNVADFAPWKTKAWGDLVAASMCLCARVERK